MVPADAHLKCQALFHSLDLLYTWNHFSSPFSLPAHSSYREPDPKMPGNKNTNSLVLFLYQPFKNRKTTVSPCEVQAQMSSLEALGVSDPASWPLAYTPNPKRRLSPVGLVSQTPLKLDMRSSS